MTDTHDDERFEEFLRREAREINVPRGEVPRDAMWAAIERARASRGVAPHKAGRPPMLRYAPWIGMAATLLLGIGLGRFAWNRDHGTNGPGVVAPSVAMGVAGAGSAADAAVDAGAVVPTATDPIGTPLATSTMRPPSTRERASARTAAAPELDRGNQTYRVASDQHLSRAEALVAVVAATSADAMMDSLTAKWARDILTNTRLLLDSPAGEDPVRRKLLEDLETVLVQLVQRSGRTDEDRAMLDRTLQRTQLLTRLRSGATGT
ncbi:MAG: hypothetical protein ACKVS7_05580 [Gemmatimonadaceae bacterium]